MYVHARHSRQTFRLRLLTLAALCIFAISAAGCGLRFDVAPGPAVVVSPTCDGLRGAAATAALPTRTLAHGHLTYSLSMLGPLPLTRTYRAGDTMRFLWCAVPNFMSSDSRATNVDLVVRVEGPYTTLEAAMQAQMRSRTPPPHVPLPPALSDPLGPVVVTSPTLHTDTWTNADQAATITLPPTLAPGYYLFEAMSVGFPPPDATEFQGQSSQSGTLRVTPA